MLVSPTVPFNYWYWPQQDLALASSLHKESDAAALYPFCLSSYLTSSSALCSDRSAFKASTFMQHQRSQSCLCRNSNRSTAVWCFALSLHYLYNRFQTGMIVNIARSGGGRKKKKKLLGTRLWRWKCKCNKPVHALACRECLLLAIKQFLQFSINS